MADKESKNKINEKRSLVEDFRSKISLQFFVFFYCTLFGVVLLIIYTYASAVVYKNISEKELISDVKEQCDMLSDNLKLNDYVIDGVNNLDLIIDSSATRFDGRIIIADENYKIIKDTYREETGAYLVSEEVIDVMTQKVDSKTLKKDDCIEYVFTVKDGDIVKNVVIFDVSKSGIKAVTSKAHRQNGVLFAALILLTVATAFLLGKGCVRGIQKINKKMEGYRDGHLAEKISVKGFKEFRTLTHNYNGTIERLMVIDSTRQEFVSNVSHELKTPITSMKVLADSLVQNPEADLDMYKEFMTDIVEEIDRETKIINDLLTLVKMDKKEAEISITEVDINALLEMIVKRVSPIAANRGIDINLESYRNVTAEVDEVKLSLALNNIIENAVKYNIDKGWVKVTLNADHTHFHIKVSDSGVGIPDDCKEHVFERFYRVDKARSRDTGGTGLGLAITKNVIRMHKGSIKLYSESGEGTTFTIKIPLKYEKGDK